MAIDQVIASLSRVPLFAGLKPLQIAEIGRRARRCAFGSGEVITRAGEPGDGAFLILSGTAACMPNPTERAPLEPVEPGSLVGELAMFIEYRFGVTVVARDWVDCLKLERSTLAEQMWRDPDIAICIADVIRSRLAIVAAELQAIDRLLMASIEHAATQPRLALLQAPPAAAVPAKAIADAAWAQ